MVVAEGSAVPETGQGIAEASGVPSDPSAAENDNNKIAHTSSSGTESELGSNGHVSSENGATHTADGLAVAVAVGTGVEDTVQAGDVLTAEEADKAWEQYIIQVCTVRTARTYITSFQFLAKIFHYLLIYSFIH